MEELNYKDIQQTTLNTSDDNSHVLSLEISDKKFARFVEKRNQTSQDFYRTKKNLYERQDDNLAYLLGRQHSEDEYKKDYESDFIDNAIYEAEATIKPIALSRMPELAVKPGRPDPESKLVAKQLSKVLDSDLKKRENRRVLAMAFKHLPIFFIGAIKYKWNPKRGKYGDYEFEFVHPKNLILDHNAKTHYVEDMDYITEYLNMSLKEILVRFPKKKQEVLEACGISDINSIGDAILATEKVVRETWFKWYGDDDEITYGVGWTFHEGSGEPITLEKIKNPNWDWEGETKITADPAMLQEQLLAYMSTGAGELDVPTEQIYHNFLPEPEFPYILLGYDQLGEMPYDETSRIEQVKAMQKTLDDQGRQTMHMLKRARGKHVFSTATGLQAEDIEEMDMSDPDSDVLLNGDDIRKLYNFISGEQPSPALFENRFRMKDGIFEKMGVNATTRGVVETDTATTAQIARESDFGRLDDMTEETINYAAERMARAALQMMRLRYTEEHFVSLLGKDGNTVFASVTRDLIEDGMEVEIAASASDKVDRKRTAMELASMQLIDPMTFYEDMELSDPELRTERLMIFTTEPMMYLKKYVEGMDITQMADQLNTQSPEEQAPQQAVNTIV